MLIRATNVHLRFGRIKVLDGLDLQVPEGAVYGLVGANGSGKTTTLKILMNIHQPSAGSAEVLGVSAQRLGPREWQQIGYVSENQELPGWMTVAYFLKYLKQFYPSWDDNLAAELLRQFDLPASRRLRELSRGMFMKAALVSSLAYRPRLLVLDEPFSGLDVLVRDEVIGGLMQQAKGMTILISSHDLADLESFSTHIGYLDQGRLLLSEEMQPLRERFREVEVTLDAPPALSVHCPANWVSFEPGATQVRFIDMQFDAARSEQQIRQVFPSARNIEFRPMPLRSIFLTLAKSVRKAAAA